MLEKNTIIKKVDGVTYSNKYGLVDFEYKSDVLLVDDVRSSEINPSLFYDLNDLEKVALITSNRHIQIAFNMRMGRKGYVLFHESANQVRVLEIVKINYEGPNAAEELERCNSHQICC